MILSRRWLLALVAIAAALLLSRPLEGDNAIAQSDSSLAPPAYVNTPINDVAADDPLVQALHREEPQLDLEHASLGLKDSEGNVWSTRSRDGDVCMIERTAGTPSEASTAGWMCRTPAAVAKAGIVGGVPGHWIGLAPAQSSVVTATTSDGARRVVQLTSKRVFRLPKDAIAVTIAGHDQELPGTRAGASAGTRTAA
jgi:hypothetical protein